MGKHISITVLMCGVLAFSHRLVYNIISINVSPPNTFFIEFFHTLVIQINSFVAACITSCGPLAPI